MKVRIMGIVTKCGLVMFSITITVLCLEGIAAFAEHLSGFNIWDHRAFRLTQPPPYQTATYYSAAFIDESFRQPGGWIIPPGTNLVIPGDFEGIYFHIKNGRRFTTDRPTGSHGTLYLFGGSTIYSSEVPDDQTIASHLQRYINKNTGGKYAVENLGTTSATIGQELELLNQTHILPGDIVVFYDGVNDAIQSVFYTNPKGWIIGENRARVQNISATQTFFTSFYDKWSKKSAFVRYFMQGMKFYIPAHLKNRKDSGRLSEQLYEHYLSHILQAHGVATASKAQFFHFVQPHIFARNELSLYEKGLLNYPNVIPPGMSEALKLSYSALLRASKNAALRIEHSYDVTTVLDESKEVYLDFCHVNHVANRLLAKAIYDRLKLERAF